MKKCLVLTVALAMLLCAVAHAEEYKLGLINFEKIVKESEFWGEAAKQLEGKYKAEAEELEANMNDIKTMAQDMQKQSMVLSQSAKEDKQLELKRKSRDFEDQRRAYLRKVKAEEDELKKAILEIIFQVAQEYGKAHEYTLIMDGTLGGVVYASPIIDLTEEILVEVNRSWREQKKAEKTSG